MDRENKRSRPIMKRFFVDDKENQFIKRQMEKAGIKNFSLFARLMLLSGEVKMIDFPALKQLRLEIHKIGVNVNQIAKRVNENDQASHSDIQECQEAIDTLRLEVSRMIHQEVMQHAEANEREENRSETIRITLEKFKQLMIEQSEESQDARY